MLSLQPLPPVLRLVPTAPDGAPDPVACPAPEMLAEMEDTVREWLHSEHLDGCDRLQAACREVLNSIGDLLPLSASDASEGMREFLQMVREAQGSPLHIVGNIVGRVVGHVVGSDDAADEEDLTWGAGEFLRLAEVAQKVTPLPRRL